MKTIILLLVSVLLPIVSFAADRYTYECEDDAGGMEGLCIAVPKDTKTAANSMLDKGRPPKDRSKMIADQPEAQKDADTVFNPTDFVSSDANAIRSNLPSTESLEGAAANISAQEKLHEVEQFLQTTKGATGLGSDSPTKAGE